MCGCEPHLLDAVMLAGVMSGIAGLGVWAWSIIQKRKKDQMTSLTAS